MVVNSWLFFLHNGQLSLPCSLQAEIVFHFTTSLHNSAYNGKWGRSFVCTNST